ncbi:unnamed protein product [Linum tenue]|uniref:Uncharacterized protein n=1 Tax=Linum tenue TaxID=586396 RepID=A0AAV0JBR5_9ROSI|nr:unnamed protein product [Linum tenue]
MLWEIRILFVGCRCSRALFPPSKFCLFEPRCGMYDIRGWYIETFGQDRKGHWSHSDINEILEWL